MLTFGGSTSTTVYSGAVMVSDPVDLDVPPLSDLAVSFYLPGASPVNVTQHGTAKQTSYISASGASDLTGATVMPAGTALTVSWYFLNTVEVLASDQTGAIVTLGDSITDANVSTQDTNFRWPYELARRLMAVPGNHKMGVLDHGTGGDKVTWDSVTSPLGNNPSGQTRFDRDVIAAPGRDQGTAQGQGCVDLSLAALRARRLFGSGLFSSERDPERLAVQRRKPPRTLPVTLHLPKRMGDCLRRGALAPVPSVPSSVPRSPAGVRCPQNPPKGRCMQRRLIWIDGDDFTGWCCSLCAWGMTAPRLDSTVAALAFNHVAQETFEKHDCVGNDS